MSNSRRKITVVYILKDAKETPLKNIEYRVTEVINGNEKHIVEGKTNSKGETFYFIKPIGTNICLYIKLGNQQLIKYNCLKLPNIKKDKLKISANVSAILIDTDLKKHDENPGKIKRKDYLVVSGDTLGSIAKKHNTTIKTLKSLNPNLESIHKIYPGDWIKIPVVIDNIDDNTGTPEQDDELPEVDFDKDSGTNQNGHPTEQVTYDTNTTVYHIYHDGRIERQHPKAEKYAAFIYYDEDREKHYLGKTEYLKTPRFGGSGFVYLVNIGGDENSKNKAGSQINDNNKELLVAEKEKRLSKYRNGKVGYEIFMNSKKYQRYYLNGITMATFLGALCKLGYDDISFNGASQKDGSPEPSSSHKNGNCIDVRYLRKDKQALEMVLNNPEYNSEYDHERNLKLVNTFYEFGWGKRKRDDGSTIKMLSVYFSNPIVNINKSYILPHCAPFKGHANHLHLQGLLPNIKDIDVIHKQPSKSHKDCSCNTDLTIEQLKQICKEAQVSKLTAILTHLNKTLKDYNLTSCLRKAHFIAQLAHESGQFRYNEELGATDDHYGGYKGRGYIQISLFKAYRDYGKYVGVNFLGSNNVKMARLPYSVDSAGWFWTKFKWKDLNELADLNDLIGITAIVNGGFNGFDDRIKLFKRAVDSLNINACNDLNDINPNNLTTFNFSDSIVKEMIGESFGWGLWHDPNQNKKGVSKHSVVAKEGYVNFVRLAEVKGSFGRSSKRYGWTYSKALNYAEKRIEQL